MIELRSSIAGALKRRSHWVSNLKRGSWAIAEHGLFAGTHFIMNVFLARWLSATEYGAYASAYAMFWLLGNVHNGLLVGPMTVFGGGKYNDSHSSYLRILLHGHVIVSAGVMSLLAIIALFLWVLGSETLAQAFFGLAVASPFILLIGVMRTSFYIQLLPHKAAIGGGVYLILLLSGLYLSQFVARPSAFLAFSLMGLCSLIICLMLLPPVLLRNSNDQRPLAAQAVFADHWRFARWALPDVPVQWLRENVYYLVLPISVGLDGAALFRAVMNILMPIMHGFGALGKLVTLTFSRYHSDKQEGLFWQMVPKFLGLYWLGSAVYLLLLIVFGQFILDSLYASRYTISREMLFIVGLLPFAASASGIFGSALRARLLLKPIVLTHLAGTAVTLLLAWLLIESHGVGGAFVAHLVSSALITGMLALVLRRHRPLSIQSDIQRI